MQIPKLELFPPDSDRPPFPPLLAIAAGLVAFSSSSIMTRYAQAFAPSLVIAAFRLSLASLVLVPWMLLRYRPALRQLSRQHVLLGLLSGAFLALHFASWIKSLEYTTVASSLVLVATSPLFVALLSPLLLKENPSLPVRVGLALTLAGSVVVGLSDACSWQSGLVCPPLREFVAERAFHGDLLALAGGAAGAGYFLIGRRLRPTMALIPYIGLVYGAAAILLAGSVALSRLPVSGYPPMAYLWFALLAIVPQLLAHSTYNWALRYLPAAFISVALLGEPVGSTILAYFLLGETPTMIKLGGAALILTGILIASRRPLPGMTEVAAVNPG
jgi:drug/metabolite transporter (DMT)-like permease